MDFQAIADPVRVILQWKDQAERQGAPQSDAMTLCTIGVDGAPRGRIVLLKGVEGENVHFYTNYESDKGHELARDPRAALVFYFPTLARQARLTGRTSRLGEAESDAYFATRPRLSQVGAWASLQSHVLGTRAELDQRVADIEARYAGQAIPRPPHWGGYALQAEEVELWVAHEGRLHDRARFRYAGGWSAPELLFP